MLTLSKYYALFVVGYKHRNVHSDNVTWNLKEVEKDKYVGLQED